MKALLLKMCNRIYGAISEPQSPKAGYELKYWRGRQADEGILSNSHFEYFYTSHFGIHRSFYNDKKILDVGCGPRGTLEWADMAAERVGLDPLADSYRDLGTDRHKMKYVTAYVEEIPFPDGYFDVVSSLNSLDHVEHVDETAREIIRVIAPGGLFLLLTDVHPFPTICEPIVFSWDVVGKFAGKLRLVDEKKYEKLASGMYQSIQAGIPYNHADPSSRYGILSAKFISRVRDTDVNLADFGDSA